MATTFRRDRAGRSATRKHNELLRAWRHRNIGRRTWFGVWAGLAIALVVLVGLHLPSHWALIAGVGLGCAATGWYLIPHAVVPGSVRNWQIGAWGEEMTASELRNLPAGWVVKHDAATDSRANLDHVVAGGAVFLLDSKNYKDGIVSVEGEVIRVTRIDDPDDSYVRDRFAVRGAAARLERKAETELGFPVPVYPVLVVWPARFDPGAHWLGKMAIVRGDLIAKWLEARPADLLRDDRRRAVADWVKQLRQA